MSYNWYEKHRLARSGFLYILMKSLIDVVRPFILPFLIFIVSSKRWVNGSSQYEILLLLIPAVIFIFTVIRYFTYRFYISDQSFIVESGLLSKKKINIPLHKISAIHIEQKLLHKPFNVAMLKIETAGSSKTEVNIPAIEWDKATRLKSTLLNQSESEITTTVSDEWGIISLSNTDILRYAVTTNHVNTFFIVLALLLTYFNRLRDLVGETRVRDIAVDFIYNRHSISFYVTLSVILLVLTLLYAIVINFLKYSNFHLSRKDQAYQYTTGLIDQRTNIIPFKKVQFVQSKANWLRKQFNVFQFTFKHAGGNASEERKKKSFTFPILQQVQLDLLFHSYYNFWKEGDGNRIHRTYVFRKFIPYLLVNMAITLFVVLRYEMYWLLYFSIPVLLFHLLECIMYVRRYRYYVNDEALQINSGAFGDTAILLCFKNIQSIEVSQTIFQRRSGLSNINIYTAAGPVIIPFVSALHAWSLKEWIMRKVIADKDGWL